MAEFTSTGFIRENLSTIITQEKEILRVLFGDQIVTDNASVFDKAAAIVADAKDENYRLLDSGLSSFNINAEGTYLDNLLGPYTSREGRTAGNGVVFIETNNNTPNNFILPATTNFSATNGRTYRASEDTLLTSNVSGMLILGDDVTSGVVYSMVIKNTTDNNLYTFNGTPTSNSDADKIVFFTLLRDFILSNTTGNESLVRVDTDTLGLYVGYDSDLALRGLSEATELRIEPVVGTKHNSVVVTSQTAGFYPLGTGGVTGLNPTFTGFVSVTNSLPFNSGSNPQSDAAYRAAHFRTINAVNNGTEAAVTNAILRVPDVNRVRLYINRTSEDTTEADSFTTNAVVLGGAGQAIAESIYASKPLDAETSGSSSFEVDRVEGGTETVRFTVGTVRNLNVRINYTTLNNTPLSFSEQQSVLTNITELSDTQRIGAQLYNTQLVSSILSALVNNRVIDLTAEVKDVGDPDSNFTTSNVVPLFSELLTISNANVTFNQVLMS